MKVYSILIIFSFAFLINTKAQLDVDSYQDKWSIQKLKNPILKREIKLFIEDTRIKDFSKQNLLNEIPMTDHNSSSITFSYKDLTIKIEIDTFIAINHKLKYSKLDDNFLIEIDGKPFWGTDGGIPRKIIKSVICKFGNKKISIPLKEYADLFEPNLNGEVYISKDKKRIYIYMMNSDAAGSYEVTWIIQDNKYMRRVIGKNC
jgi:hypothetical protein